VVLKFGMAEMITLERGMARHEKGRKSSMRGNKEGEKRRQREKYIKGTSRGLVTQESCQKTLVHNS